MNVLVVTNMYPTEANPSYGIFVKEQVDSLKKEGLSVSVLFVNGKKNRLNYFKSIFNFIKIIRRKQYDIIHAHHSYCVFVTMVGKAISGMKTPVIFSFHEGEVHRTDELSLKNFDFIKRLVFSKRLKSMSLKMADFVLPVQEDMIKRLKFKKKYSVMPCGVDTELFQPLDKEWCRKKLNLPFDKRIIFFPVSPLNKQKGYDILKESIKYLNRKDIYLITGGNIKHKNMPYYMNAADVVVQLSIFEASSSVLKEALAVNVPLVFTDAGDAKMVIGNAKGCFLCERNPKDVALKLNSAINFNNKCNGRDRIFELYLSLKAVSSSIINVYNEIVINKR